MKKSMILICVAMSVLLVPALASAQCEVSPFTDDGCPSFCNASGGAFWCNPQANIANGTLCVADMFCYNASQYCTGWLMETCSGGTPYCYCLSEGSDCGCYEDAKVDLLDFAAERSDQGVKLTWKTGQEVECGAFKIMRCQTASPGACELWGHAELDITIPCLDPNGADYSAVDATAKKDQSYSYYLREYDTTDRVFEYGPLFISIDDSIMNTGHVEPHESTFDLLSAPLDDDDDPSTGSGQSEDDEKEDEPETKAEDNDDSEGACGKAWP